MRCIQLWEKIKSSSLSKNFLALSLWQATNYLFPLITMPYLLRVIGTEKFGLISLVLALQAYFIIFVDFGFGISAVKSISEKRHDKEALSLIFSKVISIKLLLCFFSFCLLMAVVFLVHTFQIHAIDYFLGFFIVVGQMLFPMWFFQGIEQMKFITYVNLFSKLFFLIFLFLFVKEESDYFLVLPIQGTGVIISSAVGLIFILRKYDIVFNAPSFRQIQHEIKEGFSIFVSNLSVTGYTSASYLILAFLTNDQTVGQFSVAEKITTLFRQVLSMFSQAVFPKVCSLTLESHIKLRTFWRSITLPFAGAIFSGCLIIMIFANEIVFLVSGSSSHQVVSLLRIMIWIPFIVYFNIPFFLTLLAYNRKKQVMNVLLASSIASIVLNAFLTFHFSVLGTILSLILTELLITFGLIATLEKKQETSLLR
jgi:polysaccharide transporter, PST family